LRRTDWFVDVAFRSVLRRLESSIDLDDLERSVEQSETAAEVATAADAAVENEREEQWVLDFPSLHRDDIQAIALSLMGVWVLASSLPDAFTHVGRYLMYDGDNALGQLEVFFVGGWILPPIHVAARVAVGLCLFFGSYGITKSWSGSQNRVRITAMPDRRDESS
jgi:hypothetical protein